MTKKKVVSINNSNVDYFKLTPEDIAEQMRKDDEEMEMKLKKFHQDFPQSPSSGVEEQEEEETITMEFTEEGVKAYEKIEDSVYARDTNGDVSLVEDKSVSEQVKKAVRESAAPLKPLEQQRYQDMITDRLVSKALGSLLERLNEVQKDSENVVQKAGLGFLSERTSNAVYEAIDKQKIELRQSWNGGVINYEKIPGWAKPWIDDYIRNGLNTLLDFVERD